METRKVFRQLNKQKFTGNHIVLLPRGDDGKATNKFSATAREVFGANVHNAQDDPKAVLNIKKILKKPGVIVLPKIGVAIVNGNSKTVNSLMVSGMSAAVRGEGITEPERYVYALQDMNEVKNYIKGFRDASDTILKRMELDPDTEYSISESLESTLGRRKYFADNNTATWGLQATGVHSSPYTGQGVKLAILDTGIYPGHPDLSGRTIVTESFAENETVDDMDGHGTHTAGTAAGFKNSQTGRRYGVAYNCDLYIGKVLNNEGFGTDGMVLAGIEWALNAGCRIISMSLGSSVEAGESYSRVYETVAQRALGMGTIIIAAAGNESERPDKLAAVGSPANCPSIMAVGAVDRKYKIAYFSCGQINDDGGHVDIAGPGVGVYSSVINPAIYDVYDGTSMATPHVAGIAALYAEKFPDATGRGLWMHLTSNAKRLNLPSTDVGTGLVQAPH